MCCGRNEANGTVAAQSQRRLMRCQVQARTVLRPAKCAQSVDAGWVDVQRGRTSVVRLVVCDCNAKDEARGFETGSGRR